MTNYWLWLSVAGMGALHGLNPATGWGFAAARGVHSRDRRTALRALVPIGVGHAVSIALVAGAVAVGLSMDRGVMQVVAGGLTVAVVAWHLTGAKGKPGRIPTGHAGLALWSFMMSGAHGAGLMLVPALMPLCLGNGAAQNVTASGSLVMALAAVGVHTLAMLAVTGVIAFGVCCGVARLPRWPCSAAMLNPGPGMPLPFGRSIRAASARTIPCNIRSSHPVFK